MKKLLVAACAVSMFALSACNKKSIQETTLSGLNPANFVTEVNGKTSALYTLKNSKGMEVCLTSYGARIVSIMVPDRSGQLQDVTFGFDSVPGYFPAGNANEYGATIGRYANRIGKAQFTLDEQTYTLPSNNNGNCLHGGNGWQTMVFDTEQANDSTITFTLISPDGDQGFPGTVNAKVTYQLTADNAIDISYEATTDKKTVINLTNHAYFNLSGNPMTPILNHTLYINADNFTPTDSLLIPTGEIRPVMDTPMDFKTAKAIGQDIESDYEPIIFAGGFDHNWILNTNCDDTQLAAKLVSPETGISMEVYTNEPGIQIYTGNFLNGTVIGKKGIAYQHRTAICLETQHFPDSPNRPEWPSVVLEPNQTYHSHCVYKFGLE